MARLDREVLRELAQHRARRAARDGRVDPSAPQEATLLDLLLEVYAQRQRYGMDTEMPTPVPELDPMLFTRGNR